MLNKQSLRAKAKKRLLGQSAQGCKRRSRKIAKKLYLLEAFENAASVCFYVSLPSEVDTRPMIDRALKLGKKVLVPLVNLENKELELYEIKNRRTDLRKGAFGIPEPRPGRARPSKPGRIDMVVVPGIAFDCRNRRLGRGMGFYDRLLKKFKAGALKVGLAFSFQIVPEVPTQKHDQPLDLVLTD